MLRTIRKGDEYYYTVTADGEGWRADIYHANGSQIQARMVNNAQQIEPYVPHVIWGRGAFPSEQTAVNAVISEAFNQGLGVDLPRHQVV